MSGDPKDKGLQRLEARMEGIERELARQNRLLLAIGLALTEDMIDSDLILRAEQRREEGARGRVVGDPQ